MLKKENAAPAMLMLVAAGLSFLVCEEYSRRAPEAVVSQLATQPISASVAQSPHEAPRNFAQRIVQKINHAVHSSAHSAELMEASTQRESSLKTVQPEIASANELDVADAHLSRGPLDLSLVPGVIVLPKKQEPLASAGLYDKRTRQKL